MNCLLVNDFHFFLNMVITITTESDLALNLYCSTSLQYRHVMIAKKYDFAIWDEVLLDNKLGMDTADLKNRSEWRRRLRRRLVKQVQPSDEDNEL